MRIAALVLLAEAAWGGETAFVGVHVVPLDSERVLADHTVLVRDGTIVAVGPDVAVPDGAQRIDGRGRYLMPGLADMHTHVWYEQELLLFVANGVTTVRNLWGTPAHLRWAREIAAGERLGPTLHTTGPILDGRPPLWAGSEVVTTPDEARAAVAEQAERGYEAIKVYNNLDKEVYAALVAAAREHGMRVTGHVPWAVGIDGVLDAKQDCVEHLDGYGKKGLEALAERTASLGTYSCPTLAVWVERGKAELERPELRFVPPRQLATWRPAAGNPRAMAMARFNDVRQTFVKPLHEAGAPILLGTDCGNPFVVAGWSAHTELALLVEAGLTPYEALRAGTVTAARYLGEPFGTIAPGQRADLVLVEKNPLTDISNAAGRAGVMVRGRWLPAEEIARRLDDLAESYAKPKDRFNGLPPLEGAHRYTMKWNDVVIGEGRFTIDRADGIVLRIQHVDDPPSATTWLTTVRATAEGRVLRIEQERRDAAGTRRKTTEGEGRTFLNAFPFWAVAARWFTDLEDGASRRFRTKDVRFDGVVDATIEVERTGPRTFTIRTTQQGRPLTAKLTLDAGDVPASLVMPLQLATLRFERD